LRIIPPLQSRRRIYRVVPMMTEKTSGSPQSSILRGIRLCAILLGACASLLSLCALVGLGGVLAGLGGRMDDLSSKVGALETRLEARLEARIDQEGESLGSGLSRSVSGLSGRLSELSRLVAGLGREAGRGAIATPLPEDEAKTESRPARASEDGAYALSMEEADLAFAEGRFADAAARYSAILEWSPEEKAPRVKRAISLYRANPSDSSSYGIIERDLRAASLEEGEGAEALEVLALVSAEKQDWSMASKYFARLIELRPQDEALREEERQCARYADEGAGSR
jgi:tetratricopeptide (TPR) repeat protein